MSWYPPSTEGSAGYAAFPIIIGGATVAYCTERACPVLFYEPEGVLYMLGIDTSTIKTNLADQYDETWSMKTVITESIEKNTTPEAVDGEGAGNDRLTCLASGDQTTLPEGYAFSLEVKESLVFGADTSYVAGLLDTRIPIEKTGLSWRWRTWTYNADGTKSQTQHEPDSMTPWAAYYKDFSLIHLPNGKGWLLVCTRYRTLDSTRTANSLFYNSFSGDTAQCISDIVGYWAEEDDPTFSADTVTGPYFLVDSMNAVNDVLKDGGTITSCGDTFTSSADCNFRSALGVPGGFAREDETGNEEVFIYYGAGTCLYSEVDEDTDGGADALYAAAAGIRGGKHPIEWETKGNGLQNPTAFTDSLCVKRIDLADLVYYRNAHLYGYEESWDTEGTSYLVPGDVMGPANIWVDQADALAADGETPGDSYEYLEDLFPDLYPTAPAFVYCDGVVHLFFACSSREGQFMLSSDYGDTTILAGRRDPETYGIRLAEGLPDGGDYVFGRDFLCGVGAQRIIVSAVTYDDDAPDDAVCIYYADPEVVEVPIYGGGNTVRVYAGPSERRARGGSTLNGLAEEWFQYADDDGVPAAFCDPPLSVASSLPFSRMLPVSTSPRWPSIAREAPAARVVRATEREGADLPPVDPSLRERFAGFWIDEHIPPRRSTR